MQVSVEKASPLQRKLTVQVPGEELRKKIDARLREIGKQAKIKGFRPGRIPFKVLQQRYGKSVEQEVMAQAVQSSLVEAIEQESLRPASNPTLEGNPDMKPGGDLEFTASIEVMPEVDEVDPSTIAIERPQVDVTEKDVDNMLETLRAQRQSWNELDGPGKKGQRVMVEYVAETEAGRVPEKGHQRVTVVMGESGFEELESAISETGPGEETQAQIRFPDAYQDPQLAGQQASVDIKVVQVHEAVKPEVNEEFIQSFGIESGALDDLKVEIRNNLERELKQATTSYLKIQLVDQLLSTHPDLEVPQGMVRDEAANIQQQAAQRMGIEADGKNLGPFMEAAAKRVKSGILLSEIARQNHILVDGARVRQAIETVAETYEQPQDVIRLYYSERRLLSAVENAVLEEQVVDWALEKANVTDKAMSFNDVIAAASRGGKA
jgi:trigger factor